MKLNKLSLSWAVRHLISINDTDLFSRPLEIDSISDLGDEAINIIENIDLSNFNPGPSRRFIVPKDDLSYRIATQLDPLDSIILAAIIYEYGKNIEERRRSIEEKSVYSYRFAPDDNGIFYNQKYSWNMFWKQCLENSKNYPYAVILDISDFYNQIYHHTVENQLGESGFPNQIISWIMKLIESTTVKVSRGIPVGPHSTHLIAEASFIPIDNSIASRGYKFCRYVDDIIIFANSKNEARKIILELANILDKQQRLILQKQKTKILNSKDFQEYCTEMIEDRPINDLEKDLLNIIRKYSNGNPYATVYLSKISKADLLLFNKDAIEKIFDDYLKEDEPDFVRLRWFIRRLSQVGHPSAVNYCIEHLDVMIPALSDICHYFVSVSNQQKIDWVTIGTKLLTLLDNEIIQSNEYFQMSIYSLFNRRTELNHIDKLIRKYDLASPCIRREIILSCYKSGHADWIRELKEQYHSMDIWTKRAFLVSSKILPREERRFFLKSISQEDKLDDLLIKWAKK